MRVGIVSIYYNAFNYGAQLQARALVQIVKEYGYECEQICYDATDEKYPFEKSIKEKIKEQGLIYLMVSKFRYVVHGINVKQNNKKISNKISARKNGKTREKPCTWRRPCIDTVTVRSAFLTSINRQA